MYSGTTFNNKSGRIMGVHQKIDRVARKHLGKLLPDGANFPDSRQILYFEGKNGPDGIKRKSPSIDEPWHFIDPANISSSPLIETINHHLDNLSSALSSSNNERAAFEASWLSHAIADGLTPAHHFPLEETLKQLRQGQGNETRSSVLKKGLMLGDTRLEMVKNNWRYWGAKGAMTTHVAFELGIASVIAYHRFETGLPSAKDTKNLESLGFQAVFERAVEEIAELAMYDKFQKTGWTRSLARQTNQILMPMIIKTVVLAWYQASLTAGIVESG